MMRDAYQFDWAFALQGALRQTAETQFPREARIWPLLTGFQMEFFTWDGRYLVLILRERQGSIPSGGAVEQLDRPPLDSPMMSNIDAWQEYLLERFSCKPQDAAIVIPLLDSGKTVEEDWKMWGDRDRPLWLRQIQVTMQRHLLYLRGVPQTMNFYIPPGYEFLAEQCGTFFRDHPTFDTNVFIMTRFAANDRLLTTLERFE